MGGHRHGHEPKRVSIYAGGVCHGTSKKGGGVLGTGTIKKGGLRHGHNSKRGLRHGHESKRGGGGLKNWSWKKGQS